MSTTITESADGTISVGETKRNLVRSLIVGGFPPYEPEKESHSLPNREALESALRLPSEGVRVRVRESSLRLSSQNRTPRIVEALVVPGMTGRQVREALREDLSRKYRETGTFDQGLDAGTFGENPEQEFLQILGGPFSKQQYLSNFLEGQAKCFWELHHNPIARAYVSTFTDAVVGRGVPFKAKDPRFQIIFDEWAKRDRFEKRLRWTAHDLAFQGEIMWRLFAGTDGRVTVRLLDPTTIWEAITEPSDVEIVHGYWQQYPSPWNIYTMTVDGRTIPQTEYIVRLIQAADVLHVKVNEAYGEKRGRSDFYPALSWFKRFRDYMAARITSAQFERAFVWDVEVDGTQEDVSAALTDPAITKVPPPGSAWWHNKAIKPTPMSAKVGGQGDAPSGAALDLIRTIAAAVGIPVEYLGWGDASTKAQAITATAPWAIRVQQRQRVIETDLLIPFTEKLWQIGKNFGLEVGETWDGEFTWPEPVREDVDARMKRLAFMLDTGVISRKTYAVMAAAEANITTYDYATEQAAVAAEKAQAVAAGQAALDRNAAGVAASRIENPRSMGPEDRSNANDAGRSMRPSQPMGGETDEA